MQCPRCYDEEISGTGLNRLIRKFHVEMEEVDYTNGYRFYQCPRCLETRKQKSGFFSSGLVEHSSIEEVKEISEKPSEGGKALGAVLTIGLLGAATIALGAALSSSGSSSEKE